MPQIRSSALRGSGVSLPLFLGAWHEIMRSSDVAVAATAAGAASASSATAAAAAAPAAIEVVTVASAAAAAAAAAVAVHPPPAAAAATAPAFAAATSSLFFFAAATGAPPPSFLCSPFPPLVLSLRFLPHVRRNPAIQQWCLSEFHTCRWRQNIPVFRKWTG